MGLSALRIYWEWTWSILVLPVMVVHELAHIVACLALDVELWELGYVPGGDGGIAVWFVSHEETSGLAEPFVTLAPLLLLPIGLALVRDFLVMGAIIGTAGWAGLGDLMHLLHEKGVLEMEFFENLDGRHEDERVTVWTFTPPADRTTTPAGT